jgi:hypothetical protein
MHTEARSANPPLSPIYRWAIAGSLLINVGGLAAFLLPGQDDVPAGAKVVTVVFAVLGALGAWAMWSRRRWGANLTFVVTLLNVVSGLPALGDPPSGAIAVAIVLGAVIGIPVLVLMTRPTVRRELR